MSKKTKTENGKPKPTKQWKDFEGCQVTEDSLWEMTKFYNSYLRKGQHITLSTDPLNLTGVNTARDSGIAAPHALGIETDAKKKKVVEKKIKKDGVVVRFNFRIKTKHQLPKRKCVALEKAPKSNNRVYSLRQRITLRSIVKALKRDLTTYRKDLLPVAMKKIALLRLYKLRNKRANIAEAKKIKH
ncbi:MAG: 60S ribosomal protein L28 [archaeon]|nr:60S ribosomal protein L28 [archaeon]